MTYQFATLNDPDKAFRIIVLLMNQHPLFRNLPLRQTPHIYQSTRNQQYILLLENSQAVGALLWTGISKTTLESCLKQDREPYSNERSNNADQLYLSAFFSLKPGGLLSLCRYFFKTHRECEILFRRHFKGIDRQHFPLGYVSKGRRIKTNHLKRLTA